MEESPAGPKVARGAPTHVPYRASRIGLAVMSWGAAPFASREHPAQAPGNPRTPCRSSAAESGEAPPGRYGDIVKVFTCVWPLNVTSKRQVPEGPVGAKLVQYQYHHDDE